MFDKLRKGFNRAVEATKKLVFKTEKTTIQDKPKLTVADLPAHPQIVKENLPRSAFTKKLTPSRRAELIKCLRRLSREQLALAERKGWTKGITV